MDTNFIKLDKLRTHIPYHWKIQWFTKDKSKAICVAYIDSRDAQNLLDEVCWPENWSSEFYEVKGKLFCKVGIYVNSQWVFKSDSGALESSDNVDTETTSKWESSDAFKRACVQWGIGRFLYDLEIKRIPSSDYEANKWTLTEYINWLNKWPTSNGTTPSGTNTLEYIKSENIDALLKNISEWVIQCPSADDAIKLAKTKYKVAKWAEEEIREKWKKIFI